MKELGKEYSTSLFAGPWWICCELWRDLDNRRIFDGDAWFSELLLLAVGDYGVSNLDRCRFMAYCLAVESMITGSR